MTLVLLTEIDMEVVRSGDPDEMYRHLNDLRTKLAQAEAHTTEMSFVRVEPDNLTGVYRDGELIAILNDNNNAAYNLARAMGLIVKAVTKYAEDFLEENGSFPMKLPFKEYEIMA